MIIPNSEIKCTKTDIVNKLDCENSDKKGQLHGHRPHTWVGRKLVIKKNESLLINIIQRN